MSVSVNKERCKKCENCISFCPQNVLSKDENNFPLVEKADDCTRCRLCEMRCPDFAIKVEDQ